MSNNVVFTDNHRQANTFIKELYIGGTWSDKFQKKFPGMTVKMTLYLARNQDFPSGPFISIGLNADFDHIGSIVHGFMIANNMSDAPIKMDSYGIFEGVDCYVLVDWCTPWDLSVELTDLEDGEICFGAEIDMDAATNLNNSPTIKAFLESSNYDRIAEYLPNASFERFSLPSTLYKEDTEIQEVSNYSELIEALNSSQTESRLLIELKDDIKFDSTVEIAYTSNDICIEGNGYKIFEYHNAYQCLPFQHRSDGYYHVHSTYTDITGNETFMAPDGTEVHLRRSKLFGGNININKDEGILFISDTDVNFLNIDISNPIFVSFRLSYLRLKLKVLRIDNGKIYLDTSGLATKGIALDSILFEYYPDTNFYLENCKYDNEDEMGVIIKPNTILIPDCYSELCQCSLDKLIMIYHSDSKVEINNTKFVGGKDTSIKNFGNLIIDNCEFSNISGDGIDTYCYAKISNCMFHDITQCGVRQEFLITADAPRYMEVTDCLFKNIGHYGSNTFAIWNTNKAYIANNEFIDTNYGAIRVGHDNIPESCDLTTLPCDSLVIGNLIHYTDEWV